MSDKIRSVIMDRLYTLLSNFYHRANDNNDFDFMEDPLILNALALKLRLLDRILTDKVRPLEQYWRDAKALQIGETINFHLDGDSRMTIGWIEGPVMKLDYGLSRPKVINRYDRWKRMGKMGIKEER